MSSEEERGSRYGQLWARDELILAFDFYCRIPFQQTKASNPKVQELAAILGRTRLPWLASLEISVLLILNFNAKVSLV